MFQSSDSDKQDDEIVALSSIYNEAEFSYLKENDRYECTLKAHITLPKDYHVTYKDIRYPQEPEKTIVISHLPPLLLFLKLPPNYPSESPPTFTLVSTWLTQRVIAKLCKRLDELWTENKGLEILFTWMTFLKDDILDFLNITESLGVNHAYTFYKMALEKKENAEDVCQFEASDGETSGDPNHRKDVNHGKDSANSVIRKTTRKRSPNKKHHKISRKNRKSFDQRAIPDYTIGRNPIQMLIDYDSERKQIEFKESFYTCKICFLNKLGQHSTQFVPCFHVFCKDCIIGYLEAKINDGNVRSIQCPEDKCLSEATPGQVKDLVDQELFAKYDATLLSVTLDMMTDIVYCPRLHCQYPVTRETDDTMANYPACQYAFCLSCKMVYHGIEPCKILSSEKQALAAEYENASEERKKTLEQRYSKKELRRLVENTMSEKWKKKKSQNCPSCCIAIEKSDGCNHMTCSRCDTLFCWLCGLELAGAMRMEHYTDPESLCDGRLFFKPVSDSEVDYDLEWLVSQLDSDTNDENFDSNDFMTEFNL